MAKNFAVTTAIKTTRKKPSQKYANSADFYSYSGSAYIFTIIIGGIAGRLKVFVNSALEEMEYGMQLKAF